jgi:hypothetical protein
MLSQSQKGFKLLGLPLNLTYRYTHGHGYKQAHMTPQSNNMTP